MKQHTTKPTAIPAATPIRTKMGPSINSKMNRCTHHLAASGRQCRLLTSDPTGLCAQHLAKKKVAAQSADFANLLFRRSQDFQTAQGINHSLLQLYELLARDQISVRRAQTLAYITSLILRTLRAIDYDSDHGISDNSESTRVKLTEDSDASPNSASDNEPEAAPAVESTSKPVAVSDAGSDPLRVSTSGLATVGSAIPDPPPTPNPPDDAPQVLSSARV